MLKDGVNSPDKKQYNRPNILWICTDQQRCDTLGCYGNKYTITPNIDKLAKTGVIFDNCFCQCPVCSPSRSSFLTGRYPRTTRCRQNGQAIPLDEKTVTGILNEYGYICGLSGKLHLSPCAPSACKAMERRIDDGYSEFHWSHSTDNLWPTNEYLRFLKQKGISYTTKKLQGFDTVNYGMDEEYHQTTWCVDKAISFIEANHESNTRWMFSVNIYDPHHPFDPPKKYIDRYLKSLNEIPLPNYVKGELYNKPRVQTADHRGAYNSRNVKYSYDRMSDYEHRLIKASYWAMTDLIDKQVGRLVDILESTEQLDNTIIIFSSDHGEMLGDHGIYLKGPYFYDPLVKVPLIISWPGSIKKAFRSKALVELIDIAPTLLEAIDEKPYEGMQGKSFWKHINLEKNEAAHRDSVYSEYYNAMPFHKKPSAYSTMVFDGRYKLVKMHATNEGELYDLQEDRYETVNRWSDDSYKDVKINMLALMCDRMCWTIDPLPLRLSAW